MPSAPRLTAALITGPGGAHLDAYFGALAAIDQVERIIVADSSGASESQARKTLGPKLAAFEREVPRIFAADAARY